MQNLQKLLSDIVDSSLVLFVLNEFGEHFAHIFSHPSVIFCCKVVSLFNYWFCLLVIILLLLLLLLLNLRILTAINSSSGSLVYITIFYRWSPWSISYFNNIVVLARRSLRISDKRVLQSNTVQNAKLPEEDYPSGRLLKLLHSKSWVFKGELAIFLRQHQGQCSEQSTPSPNIVHYLVRRVGAAIHKGVPLSKVAVDIAKNRYLSFFADCLG